MAQWEALIPVGLIACGLGALVVVRRAALASARPVADAGALTARERGRLRAWSRRTLRLYIVAVASVLAWAGVTVLTYPATAGYRAGLVVIPALAVVGLAVHISGRCPRCGYVLALQTPLLLPAACERCGTRLR